MSSLTMRCVESHSRPFGHAAGRVVKCQEFGGGLG